MIKINSIRFKIGVFYTIILGAILLLYTAILYFEQRFALYRDLDQQLMVKSQEVISAINSYLDILGNNQRNLTFVSSRVIRWEGTHPKQDKLVEIEKSWLKQWSELDLQHAYIDLVNYQGDVIACSTNMDSLMLSYFIKGLAALSGRAMFYKNIDFNSYKLRVINIPYYYNNKRMYTLQIGMSRKPIALMLYGRLFFALITIPFILVIAFFLGGIITERILKPVVAVTRTARNITYQDLSVRVKAEHVDEELQYLVDAFNEMITRLDKSFRHIAEFSSNVAHELKTPLTIIRGESELALMKERNTQEYQSVLRIVLDEDERMFRTVEDLLLLSKLEYRPDALKFERCDVAEFMQDILQQAQKLAAAKNISVQLMLPAVPAKISADRLHLRRLFLNLISNAVKYTPNNGRITITVTVNPGEINISVSDTGAGIAPQDMDKIFNRFFRVDRTGEKGEGGTGLGLSIAQSIAKSHRGSISVASTLGKGSEFTVALPREKD